MAKQKSKIELLNDILTARRRLEKILNGLSDTELTRPGVIGEWSVKDVLAHLTAWEQLFLSWYNPGLGGKSPQITPVGMSRKAMDAFNQEVFLQNRDRPFDEILAEFRTSYQQVLAAVQAAAEEDLFTAGRFAWTGKLALVDYVAGNTCNHYDWARGKIREWLKTGN